ncbi:hypothetical protein KKH18_11910 [bacterium]|nr:hypothetical protein [bacterium]
MFTGIKRTSIILIILGLLLLQQGCASPKDIARPEKVVSKREALYEKEVYVEWAQRCKEYYDVFPSEDAYANWMYAARYAEQENYEELLMKGVKKYPANPTLLYLAGLLKHGAVGDFEGQRYFERSIELDPTYNDPWFGLVGIYMERRDEDKLNNALRRLLKGAAIAEEVMDYNYNVLTTLDRNAILITNGDNDTYPCWVLQRILNYRTDVTIVNRSLMNTEWYPGYLMEQGLPRFMTQEEIEEFRDRRLAAMKESGKPPVYSEMGDSLVVYLTNYAAKFGRPVYFALTLYDSEILDPLKSEGVMLGLAIRVTESDKPYSEEAAVVMRQWLSDYRSAGLDSWKVQFASASSAGRWIVSNYAYAMVSTLDTLKANAPAMRRELFEWYTKHLEKVIPLQHRERVEQYWCSQSDVPEIQEWCRKAGIGK